MSYAIPTNELTLTDIRLYKEKAIEAGIERAIALRLARVREELVVREANPDPDFSVPGAVGWVTNYYVTRGGVGAGAWTDVFSAAALAVPTLDRTKLAVFYKIADHAVFGAVPVVTAVRFSVGPTGATTKASFFTQAFTDNKLESEVYLSEPVIYDPDDTLFIEFYGRANTNAAGEELSFGAFIIERTGMTVS